MFIKKVLVYDFSYAEYIVSDGIYDIICMCESVPLPNGTPPMPGMNIISINVFSFNKIIINKIEDATSENYLLENNPQKHFEYNVRGEIIDAERSLIKVYDFIISLEKEFPDGLKPLKKGDVVEFVANRLDCTIKI